MSDCYRKTHLTEVQKGIYFDCQIEDPTAYNIALILQLENLNELHLVNAAKLVVAEQEALRSCIEVTEGIPVFLIYDGIDFDIARVDLVVREDAHKKIDQIIQQEINKPFTLTQAPLFRGLIIKISEEKYVFLWVVHHLVCDGVSLDIFRNKLLNYYQALSEQQTFHFKEEYGFSNFAVKESEKLQKNKYSAQKDFWIRKIAGMEPVQLPSDVAVQQKRSGVGKERRFPFPLVLSKAIHHLSVNQEVTNFVFFLAAFFILLSRYSGQSAFALSSPFSYRPGFHFEESMGCFIHTLPLQLNIKDEATFSELLQSAAQEFIQAYKNIGYPINLILREHSPLSMTQLSSFFDVSFVCDAYEENTGGSLNAQIMDQDHISFPGSLMAIVSRDARGDTLKLDYKSEVFSDETIDLLGKRFIKLLEVLTENIHTKIQDIDWFLEKEDERVLYEFNRSNFFPYKPQSVITVFEDKAKKFPERIALIEAKRQETYSAVYAKANAWAQKILALKTKANERIGVQLERSADMVIAILGILKAGCAYVAIEPSYPLQRREHLLADADISILIASELLQTEYDRPLKILSTQDFETFSSTIEIQNKIDPFSLAYIAYTSGSTGQPKGVMIEHHSVVNTLLDLERRFPLQAADRFLFKTPYTFDISVTELFGWFIGEGTLVILAPGGEKNPELILASIDQHKITHINFVPSLFTLFLELLDAPSNRSKLESLKWIFVGGEKVTYEMVEKFNALRLSSRLENVYGPTECTLWATHYSILQHAGSGNIPIGQPLNETRCYVINKDSRLQPIGLPGELCLSGVGLARGYLNLESTTQEKFVRNPFFKEGVDPEYYRRMYRTGDLVRWLANGNLEFLGRIDFQVKIRGMRLELGEIENALSQCEGVIQAVVVVKDSPGRPALLCAYYLSNLEMSESRLKEKLLTALPPYMIPSFFVRTLAFPLTSAGKIDRKALVTDKRYLHSKTNTVSQTKTEKENGIAKIWSEILEIEEIGLDDNFFEIGGHSLSLIQMHHHLKKWVHSDFSISLLFQLPTIRLLAEYFSKEEKNTTLNRKAYFQPRKSEIYSDIAIIGMSIRVPGANTVEQFWKNLVAERESIHFYTDAELHNLHIPDNIIHAPHYVKAKGRIEGVEYFDAGFFDYSPAEINLMSPQLRLLYEGAWEALEDAGYAQQMERSKIGLFLGGSDDFEWYKKVLFGDTHYSDKYQAFTLSTNHFLATRLAYKLDIKGPAFSALTGCSTTLVTPHLACQSLKLGECDLAIAGGITVELPHEGGYFYEEGMMFSPDGHCRPFDAQAVGTVFSNGMGLVVLKRAKDALRDGDQIYAVIKGSAINNDGKLKLSFTAPSGQGQKEVIQEAYRSAGIDPETVSYVEAHGTGTALGDPIEVESLSQAFTSNKKQFCWLGSVKGNVGHTDTAAGVIGLIKVALSLKNQFIPGTVNYQNPNPQINFLNTPFKVNAEGQAWSLENQGVRRAGVNSFGVGGTNAHMILEEAPSSFKNWAEQEKNIFIFSAKTSKSLKDTSEKIITYLSENPHLHFSDVAWTLQTGRKAFPCRKSIVVTRDQAFSLDSLSKKLDEAKEVTTFSEKRNVYFLFSGQGSQYQGMGRNLYQGAERNPICKIFKNGIDEIFGFLKPEEQVTFFGLMYGDQDSTKINQTEYSQFALFATSYALAKTLMHLGIQPVGLLGHSIGEIVAATIAGVFLLQDAVRIVRSRGQLMQQQPAGAMLAVMADAADIEEVMDKDQWLSLCNTTNSCVVGGSVDAIKRFESIAHKRGWKTAYLKTSHAFHTPMMREAADAFQNTLNQCVLASPTIKLLSNVSGTWASPEEVRKPHYWAQHILQPVRFSECLSTLLQDTNALLVEVGPGNVLSTFARQHHDKTETHGIFNLIRHPKESADDVEYFYKKLGQLWCTGLELHWETFYGDSTPRCISLPTYQFDRAYYPIDTKIESSEQTMALPAPRVLVSELNTIEETILATYRSIFGFDHIAVNQDFFALGGDSLKAASLVSHLRDRLGAQIHINVIFQYTTPQSLAQHLRETISEIKQNLHSSIQPISPRNFYPASSAQSRMYALYLLDKNNLAYNLPSATFIHGNLDIVRFQTAFEKVVEAHESLRTSFSIRDNELVQNLHEKIHFQIHYSEKNSFDESQIDLLIQEFIRPFDLSLPPLFRVELIKLREEEYLLFFDIHHIVADGTSVEKITQDLNQAYFRALEQPRIQYKDFAVWQKIFLTSSEIEAQKIFWLSQFKGDLPLLDLPTDFARPMIKNFEGGRLYFKLDRTLSKQLMSFAQEKSVTLFMLFLSTWNVFLARYTGQDDLIIGTPIAGRNRSEIEETVGMFVNMLPLRNQPIHNKKFKDFLLEVKENVLNALQNQDYQFDSLIEALQLTRTLNRHALFDVCFDFQNMRFHDLAFDDLRFAPYAFDTNKCAYDLVLTCQENKKEEIIEGFIEYSSALFKRSTIERMVENLKQLFTSVVENQNQTLGNLDIISPQERRVLQNQFNKTDFPVDYQVTLAQRFEQNVQRHPNKIACILSDGSSLTYEALNQKANCIALQLQQQYIRKNNVVGVFLERNENLLPALVGILKAGAAYLPIDPALPPERVQYMLSKADTFAVLTQSHLVDKIHFSKNIILVDAITAVDIKNIYPLSSVTAEDLAYVIFTSGTTGEPKGVMVPQKAVLNFVADIEKRNIFESPEDRVVSVTTISFDIFGFESIVPLCLGYSIYLADEQEQLDSVLLASKIVQHHTTHMVSAVSRMQAFMGNARFETALQELKCILCGGENYPLPLLKDLQKRSKAKLYNMYGPTETTIWSTTKELTHSNTINIGSPIANTQTYIINPDNQFQPIGVFGELVIAGDGLALGYIHDPIQTNKKYIEILDVPGPRIYKTGDRARYLENGELELKGRLDSQIKIRGYRIELDEIEHVALLYTGIRQAAVKMQESGDHQRMVLFYACEKNIPTDFWDENAFKLWLGEKLPHYMVPTFFIRMQALPLSSNGKVDKKLLTVPLAQKNVVKKSSRPHSEIETTILNTWKEVLHVSELNVDDNFFDVGGNSLAMILVNNRLNEVLGFSLPLIRHFEYPTVRSFTKSLEETRLLDETSVSPASWNVPKNNMDIAVIGMACKFPGANNINEFWDNLLNARESIRTFSDEELIQSGVDPVLLRNSAYVKSKGFLDGAQYFDAPFFGYTDQEASLMDPQLRLLHQCAWHVLENAGYDSTQYRGKIGLFCGSSSNALWIKQFFNHEEDLLNAFEAVTLNEKDFLATRLSYKLNLKGPSFNIQTACSTSLVAIHQGIQSLITGESDMVMAGGVSLSYPMKEGYLWHDGMILSKDGHCKPFSSEASGTVSGNGCGLVLLKPLDAALRDGNHIYAVIKGSAINNDGFQKVGYTAPSVEGQRAVIEIALQKTQVQPEDIVYLEAHGTGTKIGDPIEIEALQKAWKTTQKNYCAIGSVKANVGHLDAAAGVASFIKTVLVLHHKIIPPQLHFTKPNSMIDFDNSPFYVSTIPQSISDQNKKLKAAVSSFGIGGTNAHVILEEAPTQKKQADVTSLNVLVLSAKTETALQSMYINLLSFLEKVPELLLDDIAWTLQMGRKAFTYRKAMVVKENTHLDGIKRKEILWVGDSCRALVEGDAEFNDALILEKINGEDYEISLKSALYKEIGEQWSKGAAVNWTLLYENKNPNRIALPLYVFDPIYYQSDISPHVRAANDQEINKTSSLINATATQVVDKLILIWKEVFGGNEISAESDFFALGGDSLKVITLAAQIKKTFGVDIPLAEVFDRTKLNKIADWVLSNLHTQKVNLIKRVEQKEYYEVSSAQKRLYAVNQLLGDALPYNLATTYVVNGMLEKENFIRAMHTLVERHESFRTQFKMKGGNVIQVLSEAVEPVVEYVEINEDKIHEEVNSFIRPFNLESAPLFRVKLICLSADRHLLCIDMHHIIADQASISILLKEFSELYAGNTLSPLEIQYKDFSAWQNRFFESDAFQQQLQYWKDIFKGEISVLQMPTDFPRKPIRTFQGDSIPFTLGEELSAEINTITLQWGITPYMFFVAVLNLVLWKYTGQEDLIIGTVILGRQHIETMSVVGMFANTLAIRSQIQPELKLKDYLLYIQKIMLQAYDHQACPFEMLVESLDLPKDLSRNPLFDIAINYIDMGETDLQLERLQLSQYESKEHYAKFDLTWTIERKNNQYFADVEYDISLYRPETIKNFIEHVYEGMRWVCQHIPDQLLQFSILNNGERTWLLETLNKTHTDFPKQKTISQLLNEQVLQFPSHLAIRWGTETLTYAELDRCVKRLVDLLLESGIKSNDRVAILLDRGPLQIIAIFAILKIGAAYVPIDVDSPELRIHFILADSGVRLLLSDQNFAHFGPENIPKILLDTHWQFYNVETDMHSSVKTDSLDAKSIAYIIYTSGSTGKPKGNLISHTNVIRVIKNTNYIEILPSDRVLQLSNYAFDGSVFDIFGALLNGAGLVIVPKRTMMEMRELSRLIQETPFSVFYITTALFNMLIDWDAIALIHARKIMFGGEAASVPHIKKAFETVGPGKLIHVYGPTETTVFATYYPIDTFEKIDDCVPIGYPISNTSLYILDKQCQPVPVGIVGELYIGGEGVGKGYLNNDALTGEKFLDNPSLSDTKIYRTGDLVKRLATAEIIYIGRSDLQVKIRGFRVELNEIQYYIQKIPGVKNAVVTSHKDRQGDLVLIAYCLLDGETAHSLTERGIKNILYRELPDYMVPSRIQFLEKFPLNINGKIDLSALKEMEVSIKTESYEKKINDMENIILQEMRIILDNSQLDSRDDFFRNGGHSLKAIALVHALSKHQIDIRVHEIFQNPTAELLALLPKFHSHHLNISLIDEGKIGQVEKAIYLNDLQEDSLVRHIESACVLFADIIASAPVSLRFHLSPVQRYHLTLKNRSSGFTYIIPGQSPELKIREIIFNVIASHILLRSLITENQNFEWESRDITSLKKLLEKSIPYLDVSDYDEKTCSSISKKIYQKIITTPYQKGQLPWRICLVHEGGNKHSIVWGFDHVVFDGMSGEIIKKQIELAISGKKDADEKTRDYQDYVSLLNRGPQNITEIEMLQRLSLLQWKKYNEKFLKSLRSVAYSNVKNMEWTIPISPLNPEDPLTATLKRITKIFSHYAEIDTVPLGVVHYGRSYGGNNYYDCVGEFLDVVPILLNEQNKGEHVAFILELCRIYGIHFFALLFNQSLREKYKKIWSSLNQFYVTPEKPQQLLLFNFQGYVTEKEKNIFETALEGVEQLVLAEWVVTAHYDENFLYIHIESAYGIDEKKMKSIINRYFKDESL